MGSATRCGYGKRVIVIIRFRLDGMASDGVAEGSLRELARVLGAQPGFVRTTLGRAVDEPDLWSIVTEWVDLGSYRRSLSAYDVKVVFGSVQRSIVDEPSVFETVTRVESPSPLLD
jgi:heme oxygenase (mycobilin-producing)